LNDVHQETVGHVKVAERRQHLRQALIEEAERIIATRGLAALKARDLAASVGCALGAIYNLVLDLDELILLVNGRTLAALEHELAASQADDVACPRPRGAQQARDIAIARLVRLAIAYLDFAAGNILRWRALFDHRMSGRPLPDWYLDDQMRLFGYVEEPLRILVPGASPERRALLARSLFSAAHGIVALGLEEKLHQIPIASLREQVTLIVEAIGAGLEDWPGRVRDEPIP